MTLHRDLISALVGAVVGGIISLGGIVISDELADGNKREEDRAALVGSARVATNELQRLRLATRSALSANRVTAEGREAFEFELAEGDTREITGQLSYADGKELLLVELAAGQVRSATSASATTPVDSALKAQLEQVLSNSESALKALSPYVDPLSVPKK